MSPLPRGSPVEFEVVAHAEFLKSKPFFHSSIIHHKNHCRQKFWYNIRILLQFFTVAFDWCQFPAPFFFFVKPQPEVTANGWRMAKPSQDGGRALWAKVPGHWTEALQRHRRPEKARFGLHPGKHNDPGGLWGSRAPPRPPSARG